MFQGFTQETSDFFWGITLNNDRGWFLAHKADFDAKVNAPFRALAADTLAEMQARFPKEDLQLHISRIYRDARRLYGRGPYKDRLWFTLQAGEPHPIGPLFWFEIEGTGWSHGMGFWEERADQAAAFRAAIDADPEAFAALAEGIQALGGYRLWGEEYKRPKGDLGPLINPWYNRKSCSVGWENVFGGVLLTPDLPARLAEDYAALMPMYRFFRKCRRDYLSAKAAERSLALSEDPQ